MRSNFMERLVDALWCILIFCVIAVVSILFVTMPEEENAIMQKTQIESQEFELVSCCVEFRKETNAFGTIVKTDEYLHYGYINEDKKVNFKAINKRLNYINFELTEETPKVINFGKEKNNYTFKLTREMYNNLSTSQK